MCDVQGTVLPSSACQSLSVPGKEGGGTPVDFINTPGVFHSLPHPRSRQEKLKIGEVWGNGGNKVHFLRSHSSISIDESKENTANPIQTVSRWWPLIEKK